MIRVIVVICYISLKQYCRLWFYTDSFGLFCLNIVFPREIKVSAATRRALEPVLAVERFLKDLFFCVFDSVLQRHQSTR